MRPKGCIDLVNEKYVKGWAFDQDAAEQSIPIHVYVNDTLSGGVSASLPRPDLIPHVGSPNHGFKYDFPAALSPGKHVIRVYVINFPPGANPQLTHSPWTINVGGVPGADNLKLFKFPGKDQELLKVVSAFDVEGWNKSGNMHSDLDYLVGYGIGGVRLMINWGEYRGEACMYDSQGNLDAEKLRHFRNVVYQCQEKGLVADISIISAPAGVSQDALQIGNINLIKELLKWDYDYIILDPANEHHQIDNGVTLAQDLRNLGGDRWYYGISIAGGRTPSAAWSVVKPEGCNIFRYHDPRVTGWANNSVAYAQAAQACAGNIPVYFDEPSRRGWGGMNPTASEFLRACTHARNIGIAGWCFHTAAGFDLRNESFRSQLDSEERKVMDGIGAI